MEKQQAEFADSPMLKFSTYSAGLRQWCILKVSEPEVHRCGEFGATMKTVASVGEFVGSGLGLYSFSLFRVVSDK